MMQMIRFGSLAILDLNQHNVKAVVQKCSVKKVFLEISQNSQENICAVPESRF